MGNIEIDPLGIDAHDPGAKLDAGKIQAGILGMFGEALLEVIRLATFGANKYSRGGFLQVPNGVERYTDAMMRHFLKERIEVVDPETDMPHDIATA